MRQLHREQFVARPLEDVFEFFKRPENLATITPAWLDFVVLTPSPVVMAEGTRIDYSLRPLGFRVRWQSLITAYDPPRCFVDEQTRGPYAVWRHSHTFTVKDGGVLVGDDVNYALPFGALGWFVDMICVRWMLKRIFDFRAKIIRIQFGEA